MTSAIFYQDIGAFGSSGFFPAFEGFLRGGNRGIDIGFRRIGKFRQ